ncbi:MAG: bifunctional ADP-heptose synthase, partial [Bacteroidota bacterium]
RISPEAPVPIVSVTKREKRLGGAANVALNIKALGANPILCTVTGDGDGGQQFANLMDHEGLNTSGLIQSADRVTTVKTRVIGNAQQLIRVDEEITDDLNERDTKALLERIDHLIATANIGVVVFEDYNKGVITEALITGVIERAHAAGIPVTVDPKRKNFAAYRKADLFKPNLKELREGLNVDLETVDLHALNAALEALQESMDIRTALITLSEKGVYVGNQQEQAIVPAHVRLIADVSGAGDTVISVASLCYALSLPVPQMAALANLAGGLVCEKVGVVPIDREQLLQEALHLYSS